MSREILFKAKRADNGEWVEGSLITGVFLRGGKYIPYILNADLAEYDCFEDFNEENGIFEVIPETLCQYTGLNDKNGKRIWENDILRYSYEYPGSPWLKQGEDIKYRVGAVFWQEWRGAWAVCGRGKNRSTNQDVFTYCRNPNRVEVIGNIFDNTELLEGR